MPLSQFIVYSSGDRNAPSLNGISGSLLNVLDQCLVTGYGTKPAAGWTKPFGTDPTQSIAAYRPPSGSRMNLLVYDNNPSQSFTSGASQVLGRCAWWVGWEQLYGLTGSSNTSIGSGSGNFPQTAQLIGTQQPISSSYVVLKSITSDAVQRFWIMFADAYCMHLFIQNSSAYGWYHFGSLYSLKGPSDVYNCWINGRYAMVDNDATSRQSGDDYLPQPPFSQYGWPTAVARVAGGGGPAALALKISDGGKCTSQTVTSPGGSGIVNQVIMQGVIPAPNATDNTLYFSPVWIGEGAAQLRGRIRGLWMICHPASSFSDGQTIQGANELAGKTFQIVKPMGGGSAFAMEISPTLESN